MRMNIPTQDQGKCRCLFQGGPDSEHSRDGTIVCTACTLKLEEVNHEKKRVKKLMNQISGPLSRDGIHKSLKLWLDLLPSMPTHFTESKIAEGKA